MPRAAHFEFHVYARDPGGMLLGALEPDGSARDGGPGAGGVTGDDVAGGDRA